MQTNSVALRLLPVLEPLQAQIADLQYRVVPSTADADDDALRALPLPRDWHWTSLESYLRFLKPDTVLLQLPAFWQVEPFVHQVLRKVGVPACIVDPINYPLDSAAIRLASANAAIVEPAEADAMVQYLQTYQVAPPTYWVVVHAVDASPWHVPSSLTHKSVSVVQEVHFAPGVPLLEQCEHSSAVKQNLFHQSDIFVWNTDAARPTVSTKNSLPFMLRDFALPFQLEDRGVCVCGKRLYARAG